VTFVCIVLFLNPYRGICKIGMDERDCYRRPQISRLIQERKPRVAVSRTKRFGLSHRALVHSQLLRAKIATEFRVMELRAGRLPGCVSWPNLPLVKIIFVTNVSPKPANIFLKSPRFHIRIPCIPTFITYFEPAIFAQNSKGERLTNPVRRRGEWLIDPTSIGILRKLEAVSPCCRMRQSRRERAPANYFLDTAS